MSLGGWALCECPFGPGFVLAGPWLFLCFLACLGALSLCLYPSVGLVFHLAEAVSSIRFLVQSLGTPLPLALTGSEGSVLLEVPGNGQRITLLFRESSS